MSNTVVENRIDLNGMSYAEQAAAGTNNVVTAAANTKGIKIAFCAARSNTAHVYLNIGGNKLVDGQGSYGFIHWVSNVFVPPGVALDLIGGASCLVWVWYEVIT